MHKYYSYRLSGKITCLTLFALLLISLATGFFLIVDEYFLRYNRKLILNGGDAAVNRNLYQYFQKHDNSGKILSTYDYLYSLPKLKDRIIGLELTRGKETYVLEAMRTGKNICEILDILTFNNEIRYLLVDSTVYPELFHEGIRKKQIQEIFRTDRYVFYETACK